MALGNMGCSSRLPTWLHSWPDPWQSLWASFLWLHEPSQFSFLCPARRVMPMTGPPLVLPGNHWAVNAKEDVSPVFSSWIGSGVHAANKAQQNTVARSVVFFDMVILCFLCVFFLFPL